MTGIVRIVRGVLAAVAILAVVVGTPVLLVTIAPPLAALFGAPDGGTPDLIDLLFRRDDGSLLIGLLTVVAWVTWTLATVCIVVEIGNALAALRHRPRAPIRLPGMRVPQAVAAGLVLAALSLVVSPVRLAAAPPAGPAGPPSAAPVVAAATQDSAPVDRAVTPRADPAPATDRMSRADDRGVLAVHEVVAGDHLWALAEQYYDDGSQWRTIARANPVLRHHGPDDLQVGWQLVVPRPDAADVAGAGFVVTAPGDSLSTLAAEHLGSADRWSELYDANRTVLSDPDELAAGTVLALPGAGGQVDHRTAQDRPEAAQSPPMQAEPRESGGPEGSQGAGADGSSTRQTRTGVPTTHDRPAEPAEDDAMDPLQVTRGVGGMLAAAVVAGLAVRRIHQLRVRPVGRRISHPGPDAVRLAQSFGRGQHRDAMLAVDRAMRLVAGDCRAAGTAPPRLQQVRVGRSLELVLADAVDGAPAPFRVDGRVWAIPSVDDWMATDDPYPDEVRPWPALVTVGTTADDQVLLVNLEEVASLGCDRDVADPADGDGPDAVTVAGVLTAVACELAFHPWSAGTRVVILVEDPDDAAWAAALDTPDVSATTDVDGVIARLERRAAAQRAELDGRWGPARRLDPDRAEAWVAEVVVALGTLSARQRARLCRVVGGPGRTTQAVVLAGTDDTNAGLHLDESGARLQLPSPHRHAAPPPAPGVVPEPALRPHHVSAGVAVGITDLLAGTTGPTTPAPWWSGSTVARPSPAVAVDLSPSTAGPSVGDHSAADGSAGDGSGLAAAGRRARSGDDGATASMLGIPPARASGADATVPGGATVVRLPTARESRERTGRVDNGAPTAGDVARPVDGGQPDRTGRPQGEHRQEVPTVAHHADEPPAPMVQLLGPIELIGARGTPPARARKQCIEYCAWLLEHPASTATAMAAALVVAEGTRRSNMSRLRSWLGEGDDGPYLPDAYSGRISLADDVSSDWHQLQLLVGRGVDRAGDGALIAALELVRGAPLADAAPGQWIWAEELRTDIASVVRDIGVELSGRALSGGNIDLARWAAARALVAAPADELLLGARIRTEHAAGNRREVDRLAMQLATQSRRLGVDLADETVELLQFVVEGAVRAREV